jgi:hypothetical protein
VTPVNNMSISRSHEKEGHKSLIVFPGEELSRDSHKRMKKAVMRVIRLKKTYEKEGAARVEPGVASLFSNLGRRHTVLPHNLISQDVKFIHEDAKNFRNDPELPEIEGGQER